LKSTPLNYTAFNLAMIPSFDLESHIIIIGSARSGKSTLLLQFTRRIYSIWLNIPLSEVNKRLIDIDWLFNNYIYTMKQTNSVFQKQHKSVIGIDDAYFIADKRQNMSNPNIQFTHLINGLASHNNIVFTLIQNLTDLDTRIVSKSPLLILDYGRGVALGYTKQQNFPIIKSSYDFEIFERYPRLLSNEDVALELLRSRTGYTCNYSWSAFKENDVFWNQYKSRKESLQNEISD
jgi:hypothetical protein